MKRKAFWSVIPIVVAILLAGILPTVFAAADDGEGNPVSLDVAKQVAVNHLNSLDSMLANTVLASTSEAPSGTEAATEASITEIFTETVGDKNIYYVINLAPEGWVIVSADYVAYPIIAYSDEGSYSEEDHPPAFDEWMENVKEEIYDAITNELTPLEETVEAWSATASGAPLSASSVAPLMTTTWSQGGKSSFLLPWFETYDYYCPWEKSVGHYRVSPTGCVATALGQIMRYHEWPPTGRGSHTWDPPHTPGQPDGSDCSGYGACTVNFAARNYQWSDMPVEVKSNAVGQIDDNEKKVARVLRDIGVALEMNYTPSGSGACVWQKWTTPGYCSTGCDTTTYSRHGALKTLRYYYRYHATYTARKACYSSSDWVNLLKGELNAERPILYAGENSGGHAFVCDGYDASGKFHFNWGWDGSHNGYFSLHDLTPGSHNYSSGQEVVYGIRPDTPPVAVCQSATLYLGPNGQAVLKPYYIDGGCHDPDGSSISLSINRSQFSCTHVGTVQTVTLTAKDGGGQTDTCEASVNVVDNTPPQITCPADVTIECDESTDPSNTGAAMATDNCSTPTPEYSDVEYLDGCSGTGQIERMWVATDDYDNSSSCMQVITVVDTTPPQITCPADVIVKADMGQLYASGVDLGTATASDTCSDVVVTNDAPEQIPIGANAVTWTATDECGNTASCTQTVVVTGNADTARLEGYWQHQYSGKGKIDFDQTTLEGYLAIIDFMSNVFNEARDASTIEKAHDVLFLKGNDGSAIEQLDRELLVAWLNFANGAIDYTELLDTDKDGAGDTPFVDVVAAAEEVRLNPDATKSEIKKQTNIVHHVIQMTE